MGEAEIAGAVGGFVGVFIAGAKWAVKPIIRQFNHLCCFSSNITSLKDEAMKLDDETRGLQMKVGVAKNNAQLIVPQVDTWLRNSNKIKDEANRILDDASDYLKLRQRFSLSKKATKTTTAIKELMQNCKFGDISGPPPIAATAPIPLERGVNEFESRRKIEEGIMASLQCKDVNMVGICGMGGVGKTTMARKMMNMALKEGLFDEVVMVVVSQPVDKLNIQLQIAEPLGLKLEQKTLISRANKLRERLMESKRALLVLDDVWGSLNLEELGIPCGEDHDLRGCTTLLTSRNKDVLKAMYVEKVYQVEILYEEEAWILFRDKAGECVDDTALNFVAKQVMKECKGLPIALASVGATLKDVNGKYVWEDALRQLRKSNPSDIPNIITEVYNPLKLSYDRLDSKNAKSAFLLCCLFAQDDNIRVDHLIYFATGLRLFEDIWELEEVRGRMCTLVEKLKTRCLLLDGSDDDHVRMHDVVRDVSIFIASKERYVKCSDCAWISTFVDGRARESGFLNLNLLFIDNKVEQAIQISDDLIAGTKEMNVLFIKYGLLTSLPHTTQLLKTLRTLVLYRCDSLTSISVVGLFESLEILIFNLCGSIEELPVEVMGLKWLRLLEVSNCFTFNRVAPGVISSLVALEELKIVKSFGKWEGELVEGKERENAWLRELEFLINLRCLEIEVWDPALAAQQLCLSPKLVKFSVQFGAYLGSAPLKESYDRKMSLHFSNLNHILGDLSTNMLLTCAEYLVAEGRYVKVNINLAKARNIRWLALIGFRNVKNIISSSATASFPLLEFISLKALDNLEELNSLKEMDWIYDIVQENRNMIFPELKRLDLRHLPKLTSICKGIQSIELPKLVELDIRFCGNMKCFVSSNDDDDYEKYIDLEEHYQDHDSSHLFCQPKVSFGSLKIVSICDIESKNAWCDQVPIDFFSGLEQLRIDNYNNIMSLFSSSIALNLVNLRKLDIFDCQEMVKVIEDSHDHDLRRKHSIFPSLEDVSLSLLSKLEIFCECRRCALELPSLQILNIRYCDEMTSFTEGSLITPALRTITINDHVLESVEDLNGAVQVHHHFQKAKEREGSSKKG